MSAIYDCTATAAAAGAVYLATRVSGLDCCEDDQGLVAGYFISNPFAVTASVDDGWVDRKRLQSVGIAPRDKQSVMFTGSSANRLIVGKMCSAVWKIVKW